MDAADRVIVSMLIFKDDMTGNHAEVRWETGPGQVIRKFGFQPTARGGNPFNRVHGDNRGHNDFLKQGNRLRIFWYGRYFTHTLPEIANRPVAKIQFVAGQLVGRNLGNQYVTINGLTQLLFQKQNVTRWRDVPNQFTEGDTFSANVRNGQVLLRGMPALGLGALGNDWEKMRLKPGLNQIRCVHSDWATTTPDFRMKYREVYL